MTVAKVVRIDQVTELTRDISLPLPPIGATLLDIILEAISDAWTHVKTAYPRAVLNDSEPEISALLVTRLNAMLNTNALLALVVSSVHRGSETISYDGSKFEGRPDLVFTLTGTDTRFNLVGESKIIDLPNNKNSASLYRNKGIKRFVDGEYAWGTKEALVVAYVRCGAKLHPTVLGGLPKIKAMNCSASSMRANCPPAIPSDTLGTSTHGRAFSYVHKTTSSPGDIELWHLWLDV